LSAFTILFTFVFNTNTLISLIKKNEVGRYSINLGITPLACSYAMCGDRPGKPSTYVLSAEIDLTPFTCVLSMEIDMRNHPRVLSAVIDPRNHPQIGGFQVFLCT
jgi:hypothetical protein